MDIQVEAARDPFCISFKRNGELLMALRVRSLAVTDLQVHSTFVIARFPHFTLNLNRLDDEWTLSTSPADSVTELAVELPGYWYGHGELINQQWPLNRVMLQMAPLHTFDNGPTGL